MLFDYHTHSAFSDDSDTPLKDMLDQACRLGLSEIAVTDHFDPGYPDPEYPFELAFDEYHRTLEQYQKDYEGRLQIVKGIEMGIQHDQLDRCARAAQAYDYDYIIGSFHCALGEPLYQGRFFEGKTAKRHSSTILHTFMTISAFIRTTAAAAISIWWPGTVRWRPLPSVTTETLWRPSSK